jgi:ADP-ribose pyrophosphatase YjhB (NUDIX family)
MTSQPINKFNIRVYGIHIHHKSLLVTDEFRLNMRMTKLPGGGLEFGEGTIDCLKRECKEELGNEIFNTRHFYTTDFFQPTTLIGYERHQLISIYYTFDIQKPYRFKTTDKRFDFEDINGAQTFRWVKVDMLTPGEFTFPIDKKVATLIKKRFS